MTQQDQISRLEGLLERIKRNAAAPRVRAAAAPPEMPAELEEDTDEIAVEEPAFVAAPQQVHEEETSMVRAISEPSDDVEVTVDMVESEALEDVEFLEEEIVDITDAGAVEAPMQVAEAEEAIEPPASSRRPIAASMTEALAGAAEAVEMDEGREIPLKTPPPESGPQEAPPPHAALAAPPVPDVEELSAGDIVSGPVHAAPTVEQLGGVVELEEAEPAELEIGEPLAHAPPARAVREEAAPGAEATLEPVQPQVIARPSAQAGPAAAFVSAARTFHPQTFVELLDASLGLGD